MSCLRACRYCTILALVYIGVASLLPVSCGKKHPTICSICCCDVLPLPSRTFCVKIACPTAFRGRDPRSTWDLQVIDPHTHKFLERVGDDELFLALAQQVCKF